MRNFDVIQGLKVFALYACIYAGCIVLLIVGSIYKLAENYDPDSGPCFEHETMLSCIVVEYVGANANYALYLTGAAILTGLVAISRWGARQRARIAAAEAHLSDD